MPARPLPHIGLTRGSVSADVLVCGDPGRATRMAGHLEQAELLGEKREYRTYKGLFHGRSITICSHGIGAPGAAIAFEELIAAGARRIIRVGTCGGLQPDVETGALVVATAAVDRTGYGRLTAPTGYPAVADPDLTVKLRESAREYGRSPRAGIVLTTDNFYAGVPTPFVPDYRVMASANVQAVEMECAALFVIGSLRMVAAAAILAVDGNVLTGGEEDMDTFDPDNPVVQTAVTDATLIALYAFQQMAANNG